MEYNNLLCQFLKTYLYFSIFIALYLVLVSISLFLRDCQSVIYLKYYFFLKIHKPNVSDQKEFSECPSEFMIIYFSYNIAKYKNIYLPH